MKKALHFLLLTLGVTALLGIGSGRIYARVGGGGSASEAWCAGASGVEVCLDAGDFFPTTTAVSSLGTASLKWKNLFLSGNATVGGTLAVTGATTQTGDFTAAGNLYHTPVSTQTITAGATISVAGACNGLIRLAASSDVTTSTTDTFTHSAGATTAGCVYYVVNTGGGIITLDSNANFATPADVPLGTNDGVIVVDTGNLYIRLGTSDN